MRVMYITDLHGNPYRYERIIQQANERNVGLVILGADILPKGNNLHQIQGRFINNDLPEYFKRFDCPVLLDVGNDDMMSWYAAFLGLVNQFPHVHTTHLQVVEINGWIFKGMHFVPDYPFPYKDWCRRDLFTDGLDPNQIEGEFGKFFFLTSRDGSMHPISPGAVLERSSIEELFEEFKKDPCNQADIWLMHSPPTGLGLDMIHGGKTVGSKAITKFIEWEQPHLTLHGHIHESHEETGKWYGKIGKTLCIQPGTPQRHQTTRIVYLDLNDPENNMEVYDS